MSNLGRGSGAAIRVGIIAIAAIGVAAFFKLHSRPITEEEARRIVASGDLIGMPLSKAAERLQHRPPANCEQGAVLDFEQVPGWSAGPVVLEVKDGNVTAAYFEREGPRKH